MLSQQVLQMEVKAMIGKGPVIKVGEQHWNGMVIAWVLFIISRSC